MGEVKNVLTSNNKLPFAATIMLCLVVCVVILNVLFYTTGVICAVLRSAVSKGKETNFLRRCSDSVNILTIDLTILYSICFKGSRRNLSGVTRVTRGIILSLMKAILVITIVVIILRVIHLLVSVGKALVQRRTKFVFICLVLLKTALVTRILCSLCSTVDDTLTVSRARASGMGRVCRDVVSNVYRIMRRGMIRLEGEVPLSGGASFGIFRHGVAEG